MVRIAVLLLLLSACTSSNNEWQQYVDPKAGFAMGYPGGWVITSTKLPEATLAINGTHAQRGLSCSVYHTRYAELDGADTRAALDAISEARLQAVLSARFSQVQLVAQAETELSKLPARHYSVVYEAGGRDGGTARPYMGQLLVTVANGGIYNFFCGAPVAQFTSEGVLLARIRESLVILPVE